jgi:hypothetical protein
MQHQPGKERVEIKRLLGVVAAVGVAFGLTGCVTTGGTEGYPSAVWMEKAGPVGEPGETAGEEAGKPSAKPRPEHDRVQELLQQRPSLRWPARVVVVTLGPQQARLFSLVRTEIEQALKAEPQLAGVELLFSENVPRRGGYSQPTVEDVRLLAARFQAQYALVVAYNFNHSSRTYWAPALFVIGTLGLIPMPVGGEQSFCTVELVLMDVPSGVFLLGEQGHGHDRRTAVWGFVFQMGETTLMDEKALREATRSAAAALVRKAAKARAQAEATTATHNDR